MKGNLSERKQGRNRGKTGVCEISQPLRNRNFAAKPVRSPITLSAKIFAAAKPILAHECHFAAQEPSFRSCESGCEPPKHEILHFAGKAPFGRVFGSCEADFGTRVPFRSTVNLISQLRNPKKKFIFFGSQSPIPQRISRLRKHFWHTSAISQHSDPHFAAAKWLRNGCEIPKCEKSQFHSRTPFRQLLDTFRSLHEVQIMHAISRWKAWEVTSPQLQTVLDFDLKRKSYGRLKMTVQTMNGNVAPPFCYCWTHF